MGNDYKTFLGVPGSFFLHGWQCLFCSWAVPGGLWGHESGHVYYDAPITLFSNLTVPSPYIHAPNRIAGFHVKLVPRIFVWIPLPHAQSWSRHCEILPCMSRRVAPTLNATGPKKEASFCKKPCLASMDTLSVCVYACTRGSCVDSIWLWVRKETFSKPVFGVSKTSGEAGLARRESLQLRPCWPNIEPQMIGQKEEKKSWVARPVSGTNQRPPKPALNREGSKL